MSQPLRDLRPFHAVAVRMLSDARFRAAVYRDSVAALADTGLSAEERAWFVKPDPRAFAIDPLRNARLLTALLDEYPVSALALAEAGWRVPRFHDFFESRSFHRAVDSWESLFFAFPEWLLSRVPPDALALRAMITLEAALARVRRARFATPQLNVGEVMLAPSVVAVVLPGGAVALWERHHQALRASPAGVVVVIAAAIGETPDTAKSPAAPEFASALDTAAEREAVSVTATGVNGEPQLAFIGEGLAAVLAGCRAAVPVEAFIDVAVSEGLDITESRELLEELVADGTVLTGG